MTLRPEENRQLHNEVYKLFFKQLHSNCLSKINNNKDSDNNNIEK